MLTALMQIAVREAKRQNVGYRQYSVKCLGQICRARVDVDISGTVFEIVEPLLKVSGDGEPMDVDGEDATPRADDMYVCRGALVIHKLTIVAENRPPWRERWKASSRPSTRRC